MKKANRNGDRSSSRDKTFLSLADLTPDPQNARKHNPRNVGMLVDALHQVGAARSIVVDENGVVLAGNATIEAAAEAGIHRVKTVEADGSEIVAVVRRGLSKDQKTKLALYDNRVAELAEWNPEILSELAPEALEGMFSDKELAEILTQTGIEPKDAEPQIDKAEELRQKWGTETGQLWVIGNHRLLVGDSTNKSDVGRMCADNKPLLMVTDPPYGLGGYAGRSGKKLAVAGDESDVRPLLESLPEAVHRYIWTEWSTYPVFLEVLGKPTSLIVWGKPWFGMGNGYRRQHEFCLYYGDFKSTSESDLWLIDYKSEGINSTWQRTEKHDTHPTQKPLECMARPIRNHSGDVYDPFVGSGTTLVAAENLNRKCYAIEISPAYVAVCLERMTTAFPHLKIEKVDQVRAVA